VLQVLGIFQNVVQEGGGEDLAIRTLAEQIEHDAADLDRVCDVGSARGAVWPS